MLRIHPPLHALTGVLFISLRLYAQGTCASVVDHQVAVGIDMVESHQTWESCVDGLDPEVLMRFPDPLVRLAAVKHIAHLGIGQALLVNAIVDCDVAVRQSAQEALERMPTLSPSVVERLRALLSGYHREGRMHAARVFAAHSLDMHGQDIAEAWNVLLQEYESPDMCSSAMHGLAQLAHLSPDAMRIVVAGLSDAWECKRAVAAEAIGAAPRAGTMAVPYLYYLSVGAYGEAMYGCQDDLWGGCKCEPRYAAVVALSDLAIRGDRGADLALHALEGCDDEGVREYSRWIRESTVKR